MVDFRPDGWDKVKEGVLAEVKKHSGEDKEALEAAENLFEMGGAAMLGLIRNKLGAKAVCAKGHVALITPLTSQLTVPGRPGQVAALKVPITYRKAEEWSGQGMVVFIPDDEKLVMRGG